ncbi:hypothetical protein ACIA6T_19210 [Streptomyces sp. NPDC051740]|uniref:hypothetical protein n=1 Tax=Streptomyces sp. NPDC051740 TaxID=3365673 RepID=UPI0037A1285F
MDEVGRTGCGISRTVSVVLVALTVGKGAKNVPPGEGEVPPVAAGRREAHRQRDNALRGIALAGEILALYGRPPITGITVLEGVACTGDRNPFPDS